MLTPKENFLQILHTGKPARMGGAWDANASYMGMPYFTDPYSLLDCPAYMPGTEGIDMWGTKWMWPKEAPGAHPSPHKEDIVIKDIKTWRDTLHLPQIKGADWSDVLTALEAVDRNQHMITSGIWPGIFERACDLLGFENCLLAFCVYPKELNALFGAICDVKMKIVDEVIAHLKPDMIHSHDDWGSKHALFVSPAMWRDFLKPHYLRLYGSIRNRGILITHHADCYCEPLVEDMMELGINIWQGVTPANNIRRIKEVVKGKLVLMGGIDAQVVDKVGATEEEIRGEVRRCVREYCPGGYFIPCVTSEMAFTPGVQDIIDDELRKCAVDVYGL